MPQSKVDKEDFQAWKASPVTQWFLGRFQQQAEADLQQIQDLVANSLSHPPQTWADLQPTLAHRKGQCDGLMQMILADYDSVREETDEELAEMEKKV